MAGIDQHTVIPDRIDPNTVIIDPPAPPRGTLGEIGAGIKRGALVGLPSLVGGALQYASSPGNTLYETGRGMVRSAETRALRPDLAAQPEGRGAVVNALASGGEMLAPALAIPLAIGGGAAALGAAPLTATVAAAVGGGALFGAEQGQRTLDAVKAAGKDDATATEAARINAATTMASQTALGMVGGQLLGTFGRVASGMLKRDSAALASRTLGDLAGTDGVLKPLARQLPVSAAEAVGLNAAQAAGVAEVERRYGVEGASPVGAAIDSIGPTLGMTALMGPMALVGRAMQVRAAKIRTESLAHPETSPEIRTQLADVYAERLAGADPAAAQAFRANAQNAIDFKLPLEVDSRLLSPGAVQRPNPAAENGVPTTPLLGVNPDAGRMVVFPDGTTGFRSDIENWIGSLPPEQRVIERARMAGMQQPAGDPATLPGAAPVRAAPPSVPPIDAPTWTTAPGAAPPAADAIPFSREVNTDRLKLQLRDDVTNLHEQVRAGLIDAGQAPAQPLTRQQFAETEAGKGKRGQALAKAYRAYLNDSDTQRELMLRDADAFDKLQPAEEPVRNPLDPARTELPPARDVPPTNTAMAEAMQRAIKARDEAEAYGTREAQKARETEAIANVGAGARTAELAEAGVIQPDANAPKQREAIETDWVAAMTANEMDARAQSRVPFMKRLDSMGVFGMKTFDEQIAALEQVAADKKVSQGVRDRAAMLAAEWRKDRPVEAKPDATPDTVAPAPAAAAPAAATIPGQPAAVALGENIPAAPPAAPVTPPIAGRQADVNMGANIPLVGSKMPVTELAEAVADKVSALRAGFTERLRGGEKLSPLEQERYEDLASFANAINPYLEGRATPGNAEWVQSIASMVDEAAQPYKKSLRKEMDTSAARAEDADAVSPGLRAAISLMPEAGRVMEHLAQHGSAPWVRDLAGRLQPFMGKTTISTDGPARAEGLVTGQRGGVLGEYGLASDSIHIYQANEVNVLHEAVHAATVAKMAQAAKITRPANQEQAQLRRAYTELKAVYDEAKELIGSGKQYGMSDIREFVAEVHANPKFRDFLRGEGLMQRIVNAVRQLLGLKPSDSRLVERAIDASLPLFSEERLAQVYDAAPEGAVRVTDTTLQRVAGDADRQARDFDTGRAPLAALRAFLPWQTVGYIASRVAAVPELVQSGFAAGVDSYRRAIVAHDVAVNHLKDIGNKYIHQLQTTFRGMDEMKARGLEREMAFIGGEASRVGFDYRMNGRDNLAADKSIDPADKPYIDEVHRRWTQLQKQHPEVAKLLEEGERINRRTLTEKVATIATNLMDARAGRLRHLEAELARMTPQDANFARKQDEVRLATTESLMAERFSKALDMLDPTLQQGKNPDPARFHDAATASLAARLQQAFDAARALPNGSPLKEAMTALQGMYAKEAKHPYFHLGRDGEFFVKVDFKGVDAATSKRINDVAAKYGRVVGDLTRGDSYAFFRVNSRDEANTLHDRLVAAGEGRVQNTAWGRTPERLGEVMSAAPALRSLFAAIDDLPIDGLSAGQADLVKQAMTKQILSMLPETAARSASMGRRGIPGYNDQFVTNFAKRALGGVHETAGLYTSRAYMAAAQQRAEAIRQLNQSGSADARQRAQLVDDEINKRYVGLMKTAGPDAVTRLTSLSHSFYLGLSPAFIIQTQAQLWHRGLPFVGSKFGHGQTMAELFRAQGAGIKMVANALRQAVSQEGVRGLINVPVVLEGLNLSPGDTAFVREAHAQGKMDLGESSQLLRAATGEGDSKFQNLLRYTAATTQYAEMASRFALGLAAYRLASRKPQLLPKGMTPEQYGMLAMEMGMDDFSPANTARAIGRHGFAGPVTPLLTQFQNYSLQFMQQLARTVHDGFFGQDKSPEGLQRAKEAKRELAGLMATTGTMAGALGMPFANAFAGAFNTLMSDPDDPKDVRIAARQWAMDVFGPEMGTVLLKGLPAALNLDTSRFGAQNLLPGSSFLADRTMLKERSESQVRAALGPAVSLGLDLAEAVGKLSDGHWAKGVEAALPLGIRSFYKLGTMAAGDGFYTDSKGNPIPQPIGGSDLAWRALGFQTENKSLQGEAQRDFIINQQRLKHRRELIADEFVKASRGDGEFAGAVEALQAYNAKNPLQPITRADISSAVRGAQTRFALGMASGTGIPVTRRQYPVLLEQERFAAMPNR